MFDRKRDVLAALSYGVDFLRCCQQSDGAWSDFNISIWGSSDEWVTAYVCCALRNVNSPRLQESTSRAARAISVRQRPNGGWGYNNRIPPDADSTSFAIRALFGLSSSWNYEKAQAFLMGHRGRCLDGFKTFSSEEELQSLDRHSGRENRSFVGWCSSHLEVTASVVESLCTLRPDEADQLRSTINFIEKSQKSDGLWTGYWMTDVFYPTCRAVLALRRFRPASDRRFRPTSRALSAKQHRDGSWRPLGESLGCPFRTALAAETLLLIDSKAVSTEAATNWLLGHQRPDGSWASAAPFLRIPPPHVLAPDEYKGWGADGSGRGAMYVDIRRTLTTATVVSYLAADLRTSS